jgi:hypothetical protein
MRGTGVEHASRATCKTRPKDTSTEQPQKNGRRCWLLVKSLKLLIQQIHPHVRVERDSGMCVARDLYEQLGRSSYTRMFMARTSH